MIWNYDLDKARLDVGAIDRPVPLLPITTLLLSTAVLAAAIKRRETVAGSESHDERSRSLEEELIENRLLDRLHEIAIVEWGPDWPLGEEHYALVFSCRVDIGRGLVVVRWNDEVPRWWSLGFAPHDHCWLALAIDALDCEIGRGHSRVVWLD